MHVQWCGTDPCKASSAGGANFRAIESIKFEGKPPFYLRIAEVASAHALDGSVVLRATISTPELRPKSVPVQVILAIDVAEHWQGSCRLL
jgi:hypothetical protein